MSLDIYLTETKKITCDCGRVHEIETKEVHWQNITHNLGTMAEEAGIYDPLWNGTIEGITIKTAGDLAHILNLAIRNMDTKPDYYSQLNAKNGWGTYEQFLPWLGQLRDKCLEYPEATISISK